MKYLTCAICLIAGLAYADSLDYKQTLWYEKPAEQWEETLPVGNGRLGMMPEGNPWHETIVLNDISMWSGSKADYDNPAAAESLQEIQALLLQGKNQEAQELMYINFVPTSDTDYQTYGTYQVLGFLDINFDYPIADAQLEQYRRWLDLTTAIASTSYKLGNTAYVQECIVPRDSEVMLYHVAASQPGAISFTAKLARPERATLRRVQSDCIIMEGTLDSGHPGIDGMQYAAAAHALASGANVTISATDSTLTVRDADEAWIAVGAATSYLYGAMYQSVALNGANSVSLKSSSKSTPQALIAQGIEAYRKLYDRVKLNLPAGEIASLPTNERIEQFQTEEDPSLAALYYNYGRYLLISSTRPGCLPPNLQGLWANTLQTPWNGDYHTNINVQMNHWPAEPGNLPELHLPLIDLVKRAVPNGKHTAKVFYGSHAQGWVMHMMTNVWDFTDPGQHPSWGATNTGGAWLCAHLWEHYLYNPDTEYLAEVYPVMKGAAEFFLSTMIREPRHGWLVTAPSSSPENQFRLPGSDAKISVCMGPTMDAQIVRELFSNVIDAAKVLGQDQAFADSLTQAISQLPPNRIGSDGRLMEWLEEYDEVDIHHRHVSHLYGLHPSNQISPTLTPELAEACRKTLDVRGDEATGWSRAWKMNFWARLGDGNRAYKLFKSLLKPAYTADKPKHRSGTFPNLFCSHQPFQIDGNWGGTAGIGELLLQSQEGFINLLPALPDTWSAGSIEGAKVRGGGTVSLNWSQGRPDSLTLAGQPGDYKVKMPAGVKSVIVNGKKGKVEPFLNIKLDTEPCAIQFKY